MFITFIFQSERMPLSLSARILEVDPSLYIPIYSMCFILFQIITGTNHNNLNFLFIEVIENNILKPIYPTIGGY